MACTGLWPSTTCKRRILNKLSPGPEATSHALMELILSYESSSLRGQQSSGDRFEDEPETLCILTTRKSLMAAELPVSRRPEVLRVAVTTGSGAQAAFCSHGNPIVSRARTSAVSARGGPGRPTSCRKAPCGARNEVGRGQDADASSGGGKAWPRDSGRLVPGVASLPLARYAGRSPRSRPRQASRVQSG